MSDIDKQFEEIVSEDIIREEIRKEDLFKCARCGHDIKDHYDFEGYKGFCKLCVANVMGTNDKVCYIYKAPQPGLENDV